MKLVVAAIYDSKSECYSQPNFLTTRGQGERAMLEAVANPDSNLAKYPADFTFFELGTYDDSTGQFQNHNAPINLGTALEFKAKYENLKLDRTSERNN